GYAVSMYSIRPVSPKKNGTRRSRSPLLLRSNLEAHVQTQLIATTELIEALRHTLRTCAGTVVGHDRRWTVEQVGDVQRLTPFTTVFRLPAIAKLQVGVVTGVNVEGVNVTTDDPAGACARVAVLRTCDVALL